MAQKRQASKFAAISDPFEPADDVAACGKSTRLEVLVYSDAEQLFYDAASPKGRSNDQRVTLTSPPASELDPESPRVRLSRYGYRF